MIGNEHELLDEALGLLGKDLLTYAKGDLTPRIIEESGELFVALRDRLFVGGGQPLYAEDRLSAVLVVAEAVQEWCAIVDGEAWPACPSHQRGLHARDVANTVAWWCSAADGHVVAVVGQLAQAF